MKMIKATIVSPTKALISASQGEIEALKKELTYTNTSVAFQYKKHMNNRRWRAYNAEGWKAHGEMLKASMKSTMVYEENGEVYVRPGSLPWLPKSFEVEVENRVQYPTPRPLPWYNKLPFEPYYYQSESVANLIAEKHGSISLCTGAGKSLVLLMLCRTLGLKTVVVTPSVSIFNEVLEMFETYLGKGMVGAYGDGKKKLGKRVTVCVSKSLTNLKPGTPEYDAIASAEVMLIDEAHTFGASTLEQVAHGVLDKVPYRFFVSGTITRGDGTEKLLHSIVGKTVMSLTTSEAVSNGYVCDHKFSVLPVYSTNPTVTTQDPLECKRKHFLYNSNIAKFVAKLAEVSAPKNERLLVLVDEVGQIEILLPFLNVPYLVAVGKGEMKNGNLKISADPKESVDRFNKGEATVLIGTSCVSTGTNIFPTHHTINWQGGSSEIKTKQGAVGRSVRRLDKSKFANFHAPKNVSNIWDFDIVGVPMLKKHLEARMKFYGDSGTTIKVLG